MNHENSVTHGSEFLGVGIDNSSLIHETPVAQPASYHEAVAGALKNSINEFLRANRQLNNSGVLQASPLVVNDTTSTPNSSPSNELLDVKDSLRGFNGLLENVATRPQAGDAVEFQGNQTGRDTHSLDSRGSMAVSSTEATTGRSSSGVKEVVAHFGRGNAGRDSIGGSSNVAMISPENGLSGRLGTLGIADQADSLFRNVDGALTTDGPDVSAQQVLDSQAFRLDTSERAGIAAPFADGSLLGQTTGEGMLPTARVDPLVVNVDRSSLGFGGLGSLINGEDRLNRAGTASAWGELSDSGFEDGNASETYGSSPRASMSPGETMNTATVDLSKTNDLLQQLLDEVRRGRTPFLPLNNSN